MRVPANIGSIANGKKAISISCQWDAGQPTTGIDSHFAADLNPVVSLYPGTQQPGTGTDLCKQDLVNRILE